MYIILSGTYAMYLERFTVFSWIISSTLQPRFQTNHLISVIRSGTWAQEQNKTQLRKDQDYTDSVLFIQLISDILIFSNRLYFDVLRIIWRGIKVVEVKFKI